jgi:hypothetical protein
MYYGFGGFLMVASLIVALKGFWILFKFRKYWMILGHLAFIIGFPFLFFWYADFIQTFNEDLLIWLFIPIGLVIPFWFMWGFIVNGSAEKIEKKEQSIKLK